MAFNVNEFLASLDQNGVVENNKFNIQFAMPPILNGTTITSSSNDPTTLTSTGDAAQLVLVRGCGARIPDALIQTIDINRYGIGVLEKMPYNVGFTETELTFIVDKDGIVFNLFYAWLNSIFDFAGVNSGDGNLPQYLVEYKDSYAVDLQIWLYDNWGNTVKTIVMRRAFPISMSDVSLDWGTQNELIKLTVRMPFTSWYYQNTGVKLQPPTTLPSTSIININDLTSQFQ